MKNDAENDILFMCKALKFAREAFRRMEVPIGAVIVKDDNIISHGYNLKERKRIATKHAEIIAIERACKALGNWRLTGTTLYVNVEPCIMCVGAILQARIQRVVFGCNDDKFGALGSLYDMHDDKRLNHNFTLKAGVMRQESIKLLQDFFAAIRKGRLDCNRP